MSILKNNPRSSGSSVQSGARSTNSKIINWVCAAFLAGLIFLCSSAKAAPSFPYNALVNPGAESGDLTGWQRSIAGYIYTVSTNGTMIGVTNGIISTNQFLTYPTATNNKYTFQTFDTTSDSALLYQDIPAVAGSHWSASVWAICYASNYFTTALAYMSVAFFDTNGVVVNTDPVNPAPGTPGVYATTILDPKLGDQYPPYVLAPPQATDPTGWQYLPLTNFWYSYPPNPNGTPGTNIEVISYLPAPVSTNLVAPPGTAFVRYQLEFDNSGTSGGDVYWDSCQLNKLNQTDPDITNPQPAAVAIFGGMSASFTVHAIEAHYVWQVPIMYQWQKNGTNLQAHGGAGVGNSIQGDTTNATLSFTNCLAGDGGMYDCVVWVTNYVGGNWVYSSIRSVPVPLSVLIQSPRQKVNAFGANASFEGNPSWAPWEYFNGAYMVTAASVYGTTATTVNIFDGSTAVMAGNNGDRDNGFHHAWGSTTTGNADLLPSVVPGSYWKAGGWAYISSLNDYLAGNTCRMQIWFRDANGVSTTVNPPYTPTFESFKIYGAAYNGPDMMYTNVDQSSANLGMVMNHDQLPRDQWCHLWVTNVTTQDGVGLTNDIPHGTWTQGFFRVPTNVEVAQINAQVYEYCPQATDNNVPGGYLGLTPDAVYWDDMELFQIVPVTNLTAKAVGANYNLSFTAQAGLTYGILYKTNILTDTNWTWLADVEAPWAWQTNIASIGIGTNVTVVDPINSSVSSRFYRVQSK